MAYNYYPSFIPRYMSVLAGLLILAATIVSISAQAHMGITQEIKELTTQIQNNPDAHELYLLRGNLHRIHEDWSQAIDDFSKAQQLDTGNVVADLGMGRTYLDQGMYKKAIENLNTTLTRQPNNVRGLVTRAKAFRRLGKPLAAAADYKHAIHAFKEPQNPLPEYYFEHARAFEAAGVKYISAALQALDAGISRLGSIWVLEDYAIKLERKRQHYDAALQRLDRIIDRSLRKETLLMLRGEILIDANQPAKAKASFSAADKAIDALPARSRYSRSMKQLRSDIASRIHSMKLEKSEK